MLFFQCYLSILYVVIRFFGKHFQLKTNVCSPVDFYNHAS